MKYISTRWIALIVLLVVVLALLIPACAPAEEEPTPTPTPEEEALPPEEEAPPAKPIEIKFATWAPEGEPHVPLFNWFAEELDKRTAGRVKMTIFLAGALGGTTELPENVQKGVADMAITVPNQVPGLMPIAELISVPMLMPSAAAMDYIGWHLISEGLMSLKGVKILAVTGHENIVLCMSKKKVATVEDFRGIVIGTNGTWGALCAELGASEMLLPPPEIYTSVERGVVDGGVFGFSLPMTYNMEGILKYICADPLGNDPFMVMINLDKWNSLPPDIQVIMLELSREVNSKLRVLVTEQNKICYDHFAAEPGVEVYSFDPGEYDRLIQIAKPLTQEKAAGMDAEGIPGTEALEIVWEDLKALGFIKE